MNTPEDQNIIDEYNALLKDFKPVFADDLDIRLAKLTGQNNKIVGNIHKIIDMEPKIVKLRKEALSVKQEFINLYKMKDDV